MSKIIGNAILAGGGSEYPRLKGTWVFNATPGWSTAPFTQTSTGTSVEFSSNGTSYTKMYGWQELSTWNVTYGTDAAIQQAAVYSDGTWTNTAYRVITFTKPVKRKGNEAFYDWFVSNAKEVKAENLYGYKFTSGTEIPVTVPSSTLTMSNVEEKKDGTAPVFSALFWNTKIGSDVFVIDNYNVKIQSSVTYKVSHPSTSRTYTATGVGYINLINPAGNLYSLANITDTYKTSTSFIKPDTPTTSDANNIILYFADQPTGSLLTWLNTYATKI